MLKNNTLTHFILSVIIMFSFLSSQTKQEEEIMLLLKDMGMETEVYMMFEGLEEMFIAAFQNEDLPDGFIQEFIAELRTEESIQLFMEMIVPVYGKYFTSNEIAAMRRFFRSPVGKKYVSNTPILSLEMERIGEEWGTTVMMNYLTNYLE